MESGTLLVPSVLLQPVEIEVSQRGNYGRAPLVRGTLGNVPDRAVDSGWTTKLLNDCLICKRRGHRLQGEPPEDCRPTCRV